MANSMITRIAQLVSPDVWGNGWAAKTDMAPSARRSSIERAKQILKELRSPTKPMIKAGANAFDLLTDEQFLRAWEGAIDKAME
jgi:hypothetical protein